MHIYVHLILCVLFIVHFVCSQTIKLSVVEKLIRHVESSQLTSDLGGFLPYNHEQWIKLRLVCDMFVLLLLLYTCYTRTVSIS